ncbi:hypothetical protein SHIRM173S_03346 [Streptomyces hirsutus]
MVEEARRDAEVAQRQVDARVAQGLRDRRTDPADAGVVLDGDDDAVLLGERGHGLVDGLDPTRVDDGGGDALPVEQAGDLQAHRREGAHGDQQHVRGVGAGLAQDVHAAHAAHGRYGGPDGALGEADHGRRVGDLDGLAELGADLVGVARGGQPQAGDDLEDRHVPHAVVGGAVGAGDAGPVQDEGDAALVQGHVHQHLVEGAVEEGGVHGEDGVDPAVGQARRGDGAVLLGDADVVDPVGEPLGEPVEADGLEHGRGDGDDVLALLAELDHLLAEDGRPVGAGGGDRQARVGVDLADGVEAVRLVRQGGLVAAALLGEAVHDHGAAEALGAGEGGLQGLDVVAVDGAHVLQAQVLEHALRGDEVLQALLGAVQGVVERPADDRGALQDLLGAGQEALVAVGGAQGGEMAGEAADGGRVGALVVVDDDDERAVLGVGDVVQRLPGHAAGEGTVADDGDDVVPGLPQLVGLGEAVGPAEDGGGVTVLDDVVLGLGLRGVAGEAALHLQLGEVLPAGQQFVHVGLVSGVPEHFVPGGFEDAVQGQGEFHHAQVGAEVATGLGDRLDEEGPDLLGQPVQLLQGEPVQIARSPDTGQQRHPCLLAVELIELLPGSSSLMFRSGALRPGGAS